MNTPTTVSFSPTDYLRHCTLSWLFFLLLSATGMAADLTFTPNAPIVEQGKQITLSVSGTSGEVTWTVAKGQIQGTGTQVTYVAPAQVGLDVVTVMDGGGNVATVKIVVTPLSQTQSLQMENANWEIFTNRSEINALLLSEDEKTLWVGTEGGLEKRDAQTGEIQQVFINTDGLPYNGVNALLPDSQGGLWVGTQGGLWVGTYDGLAHLNAQGQWQVFNTVNSGLPDNCIYALHPDNQGGLWVGTFNGLAHYAQGQWQVFNTDNSGLPNNTVNVLLPDSQGGLWVGLRKKFSTDSTSMMIGSGLAHYSAQDNKWQVFNTDNSGLPHNDVSALHLDSQGGLWVGTAEGLAHYAQEQWQVFNMDNSGLPHNDVSALHLDSQGGLWVGTAGGLAHYTQGQWQVFNTDNSDLPDNWIYALLPDNQGGLLVGTDGGLAHYVQGQWQVFKTNDAGLPGNWVYALHLDSQGGLWVGTDDGLAHYAQEQWQVFNTDNSGLPDNSVSALSPDSPMHYPQLYNYLIIKFFIKNTR